MSPLFITQLNCAQAFGLSPRRFRELIREFGIPMVELGKLRCVEASVLLEALRARASVPARAGETNRERLRRIAGLSPRDALIEKGEEIGRRLSNPHR